MQTQNTNNGIINSVRPDCFNQVIGMDHNKQILNYDIQGSIALKQPLPSYVIAGPSGTGKSTLANIIATITKGNMVKYLGNELKKPQDIFDIASVTKDGDVVYIEEAHGIGKEAQTVLLEWIENFQLLGNGGGGLNAPKVCFVLPTTNPGRLSKPLRTRCRLLNTQFYSLPEIKNILVTAGQKLGLNLSSNDDALTLLAQSSRGTPRIAVLHRLDMLRKVMVVDGLPYNLETVQKMLDTNKINEWGLEANDIYYCEVLYDKMNETSNRAVGKKTISQSTGFDDDMVDVIESYLQQINALRIVHGGRALTPFGCDLIGKTPLELTKVDLKKLQSVQIDLDELRNLIQDEGIRKQGMKYLASHFGLKYGPDNHILQNALSKIGARAKRRIGIVVD